MPTIPVFLINSDRLFRNGLKALSAGSDLEFVGEAAGFDEAAALADLHAGVRVVLCDLAAGRADEIVGRLRAAFPSARIVVLAQTRDPWALLGAIRAGVDGCLGKGISAGSLVESLR